MYYVYILSINFEAKHKEPNNKEHFDQTITIFVDGQNMSGLDTNWIIESNYQETSKQEHKPLWGEHFLSHVHSKEQNRETQRELQVETKGQ